MLIRIYKSLKYQSKKNSILFNKKKIMKLKEETFKGRIVKSMKTTIGKNRDGEPIIGAKLWIQSDTNVPGQEHNLIATCTGEDVNYIGCDGMMVEVVYYNRVSEPKGNFYNDPRIIKIRQI
jgi:hypothetical protein